MRVDLSGAPVVDVHCHPWRNEDLLAADPLGFEDRITFTGMGLLSTGHGDLPRELEVLTESTPLALTMRRRLAAYLGCEPTRDAVARARHSAFAADPPSYNRRLWESAGVAALVYDEGHPQPTISRAEFAAASGATVHRVARIETLIARLRAEASSYRELEDRLEDELELAARDQHCVAFKSVIAYRTGLDVENPPFNHCERAFGLWRAEDYAESRRHAKPVRDRLLRVALDVARRRDRPMHIHCGGGDPSVLLRHARPQDLYPLLVECEGQPVVLVHAGWPWLEEGAYVAAVLPHVHLDVSIPLPWASLAIDQKLEVLLGVAPPAKVMFGSDEASEPEVIWLAAQLAREALGRVLGTAIERDWLVPEEARRIGEGVLAGNARRLHGIT